MKFFKNNYIFVIVLSLFLLTRIINFSDVIWYESSQRILQIMQFVTIKGQIFHLIPHFPLAVILYKIGALAVGNTIIGVKAMHLLLNIITFFLVYKTALLFYNDKKVANWSILLYAISFYAYAGNTMGIDQDLAINPLLFLLTLYLYKKYSDFSLKGILLTVLSCSLLTISRPILGIIVMGIVFIDMISKYIVENKKNIKFSGIIGEIFRFLKLFIPYLIIGGLLCYLMFKLFPSPVIKALNTYKNLFSGSGGGSSLLTRIAFLGHVFMYTSPLILSIFFLFKKYSKHHTVIIASVIMILYMCMGLSGGDPARWMMPVLPIFVIGWGYLSAEYLNKKNVIGIVIMSTIIIILNTVLLDYSKLPANITDYLSNIFDRIFILESTVFNPIFLDTKLVFGIAGFSLVFFLLFNLSKNKKLKSLFFIFSLGVNISLVSIHFFQIKQPHISDIGKQMYEFCAENCDGDKKIYSDQVSKDTIMLGLWDKNIGNYFNLNLSSEIKQTSNLLLKNPVILTGINLFTENLSEVDIEETIKTNGVGFVFVTHYYANDENNILNDKCETIKKFTGNIGEVHGIVYLCDF